MNHNVLLRGEAYHIYECGDGPPLLMLHGFTGSSKNFNHIAQSLADRFQVVCPDLLGHGKTALPHDSARYSMDEAVADLLALFDLYQWNSVSVLGYSMGGRLALGLALSAGTRVTKLILESASPGLRTRELREERRINDGRLAERILRDGVPAFVSEWGELPLFRTQSRLSPEVKQSLHEGRLANRAEGLALSLQGMGTGAQPSYWSRLGDVSAKVCCIVGQEDTKFVGIADDMYKDFRDSEVHVIPHAGHTVHLEQPNAYLKIVQSFLRPDST